MRNGAVYFFLALILFGGCRPALKTSPDTLVVGIEAAPLTLDPRLAGDAYSSKITQLLHNGLFRLSERLEVVPDLAESFEEISPTRYLFHLRSGVRFHDGRDFSAEDVAATIRSVLDASLASPFRSAMEKVQEVKILDPLTVEITLKGPFAPFLAALTLGIVPAEGDPANGTGPFRLSRFAPQEEIALVRNEDYFRGAPKMAKVVFRVLTDDNLRVLELKN
jgi:peptide/nickel transport system substrate-binding protein